MSQKWSIFPTVPYDFATLQASMTALQYCKLVVSQIMVVGRKRLRYLNGPHQLSVVFLLYLDAANKAWCYQTLRLRTTLRALRNGLVVTVSRLLVKLTQPIITQWARLPIFGS